MASRPGPLRGRIAAVAGATRGAEPPPHGRTRPRVRIHRCETAVLRFVTVHRVENNTITLWKDYWDMSGLTVTAPRSWLVDLAKAGISGAFDATGGSERIRSYAPGHPELVGLLLGRQRAEVLGLVAPHRDHGVDDLIPEYAAHRRGAFESA